MAEPVGIPGLAATRAPAGNRLAGTEVRPFAEIGLAQDQRAGRAQPGDQERIVGAEPGQCQRTGAGAHRARPDVVLEQKRNAVQGAAKLPAAAFGIQCRRFLQGIRIELQHGVEARAGAVEPGDPFQVGAGQGDAVQLAGGHRRLQLGDIGFGVGERRIAWGRGRGGMGLVEQGHGRGRAACQQCDGQHERCQWRAHLCIPGTSAQANQRSARLATHAGGWAWP
ncbi:hypothetical protein QE447_000445 [Stenotrophomonas sp. SORGH_AS282]|nr:hypothetical protein [Stenotrophomonas sp. SORGH_AS_0282]